MRTWNHSRGPAPLELARDRSAQARPRPPGWYTARAAKSLAHVTFHPSEPLVPETLHRLPAADRVRWLGGSAAIEGRHLDPERMDPSVRVLHGGRNRTKA